MSEPTTIVAGIDVSKSRLDLALHGREERWHFANDESGRAGLLAALIRFGVGRAGIEASGGYQDLAVAALREAGIETIVFQPRQVRAYGTYRLRRAKTDAIDAGLIAACAAAHDGPVRTGPDPRLAGLGESLRLVEQIDQDVARLKTRQEACRDERVQARNAAEIARLRGERSLEIKRLAAALKAHPDLARRLDLLTSIPGLGDRTALTLVLRMPELGTLTREEAASLAGLAPFDHSSGRYQGQRRIAGGRADVRTALYAAALPAAFRWNHALVDLYQRLKTAGKSHQQALIACARKLLAFANAVLERGTPWSKQKANA